MLPKLSRRAKHARQYSYRWICPSTLNAILRPLMFWTNTYI